MRFTSTLFVGLRTCIYIVFGIGTLVVVVPASIADLTPGPLFFLGLPISLAGVCIYLWTVWDFIKLGHGTPLPLDPPQELVIHGLYRVVRNPMAIGFTLILLGEAIAFGAMEVLVYAGAVFFFIHLFIVLIEEPDLKHKFGAPYEAYFKSVPRWIPRLSPSSRQI